MVKIMEDYLEIDLRQIIKNIFAKWYWVVLPTVLFGISIFLYSYLIMPDFYRAKATIIITDPRNISAFHDISEKYELPKPSATAIQRLALSDDIILQLFDIYYDTNILYIYLLNNSYNLLCNIMINNIY